MRIEQLEYVAAVTTHGSLRRASEALHISQPALSEAVTKLERELGLTLLDRRRSGSRISRQGLDLLQHMTEVLESVDRLRQAAGDQAVRARELRIGTVNTASSTLLAPALRDLHARHGSGGVEVVNAQQAEIHQGLAEGTLDLGLVNVLPGDDVPSGPGRGRAGPRPAGGLPAHATTRSPPLDELTVDRPARRALRGHAARLRHAPLRTPALRRRRARHDVLHRRRRDGQGAWWPRAWASRSCPTSPSPPTRSSTAGVITTRPIHGDATTVSLLMLRRRAEHVPAPLRDLQVALVRHAGAYRSADRGAHRGADQVDRRAAEGATGDAEPILGRTAQAPALPEGAAAHVSSNLHRHGLVNQDGPPQTGSSASEPPPVLRGRTWARDPSTSTAGTTGAGREATTRPAPSAYRDGTDRRRGSSVGCVGGTRPQQQRPDRRAHRRRQHLPEVRRGVARGARQVRHPDDQARVRRLLVPAPERLDPRAQRPRHPRHAPDRLHHRQELHRLGADHRRDGPAVRRQRRGLRDREQRQRLHQPRAAAARVRQDRLRPRAARRTPSSLQNACDRFIALEVLGEDVRADEEPAEDEARADRRRRRRRPPLNLQSALTQAVNATADEEGWITVSAIGNHLTRTQAQLRPAQLRARQALLAASAPSPTWSHAPRVVRSWCGSRASRRRRRQRRRRPRPRPPRRPPRRRRPRRRTRPRQPRGPRRRSPRPSRPSRRSPGRPAGLRPTKAPATEAPEPPAPEPTAKVPASTRPTVTRTTRRSPAKRTTTEKTTAEKPDRPAPGVVGDEPVGDPAIWPTRSSPTTPRGGRPQRG